MEYPKSEQPLPSHAKKVFEGILFDVWQWEQEMFDGSTQTFEKVSRRPSVGIFPITADGKIILTIQEQPDMEEFISLVGGIVDPEEDVVDAAHRELLEETGSFTNDMELWYSIQPVTKVEWPIYIFVARGCETRAEITPDAGEKIKLKYVTWEEFLDVIYEDKFRDKELTLHLLKLMKHPKKLEELRQFLFGV